MGMKWVRGMKGSFYWVKLLRCNKFFLMWFMCHLHVLNKETVSDLICLSGRNTQKMVDNIQQENLLLGFGFSSSATNDAEMPTYKQHSCLTTNWSISFYYYWWGNHSFCWQVHADLVTSLKNPLWHWRLQRKRLLRLKIVLHRFPHSSPAVQQTIAWIWDWVTDIKNSLHIWHTINNVKHNTMRHKRIMIY